MNPSHKKREKLENKQKILNVLSRENLTFSELLEKTELSRGALNTHRKELMKNGKIEKTYDKTKDQLVYRITQKALVEDLIVERLVDYVGRFTVWRILDSAIRKEKEVHIEEYYKPDRFVGDFIEKHFKRTDIEPKEVLEAFEKKYTDEDLTM